MVRKVLLLLKDRFGEKEEEEAMRSQLKETSKLPGKEKQWRTRFQRSSCRSSHTTAGACEDAFLDPSPPPSGFPDFLTAGPPNRMCLP